MDHASVCKDCPYSRASSDGLFIKREARKHSRNFEHRVELTATFDGKITWKVYYPPKTKSRKA